MSPPQLSVIVVGAGIAGLTAAVGLRNQGHNVRVLERHGSCQALGAPIRINPNATRVLIAFGMEETIRPLNSLATKLVFRRWQNGKALLVTTMQDMNSEYGSPMWAMARYRLQDVLREYAESIGVEVVWNARVDSIDQDGCAMQVGDTTYKADLIVGADGISSRVRQNILGPVNSKSPLTMYNVDVPMPLVEENPKTALYATEASIWIGPYSLIALGLMPDHGNYVNLALASEKAGEEVEEGNWLTLGDLNKVRERFAGWSEAMHEMIKMTPKENCYLWKLSELDSIKSWSVGNVVLVGDAAHAMLPYTGQGASQCIEDAGCLVECLSQIKSKADIPKALKAYEAIRRPRVEWIAQRGSKVNLPTFHLPDGPDQEKRDALYESMKGGWATRQEWTKDTFFNPPCPISQMSHPLMYPYMMGYDVFYHTKHYLKNNPYH